MSGIFGSNNSTVTTKTSLPSWVESFAKTNLSEATKVANQLAPPYQGPRVAGLNSTQNQALSAAGGVIGKTDPQFQQAYGAAGQAMAYAPQQITPGNFLGGNVQAYMSPYTQNVETEALRALDDQRLRSLNQTGDAAVAANAFGGSRHGVMEGVVNAEAAKGAGALSATLRDQAFRNAQGMMTSDIDRDFQGQLANTQAGFQGQALNLQGGATLADMATAGQNAFLQGTQAALGAGNQQQAQAQMGLDAAHQTYNEMKAYPLDQLDIKLNALGMTPYGSATSQTTPNSSNPIMSGVGGALAGSQLAGMLGYGAGTGAAMGGGLGILSAFLSDEDEKKNIKEIGPDPQSGLPIYSYNYKDDPKSSPKRVGPMAQDVEKLRPDMVRTIGGKKVIMNMGFGGAG